MAKNLKPALPFLDREYDDLLTEVRKSVLLVSVYLLIPPPYFPPQNQQFDVKYVLLFYYYGGMVYTCLHDYLKSLLFYTVVSSGKENQIMTVAVLM